MTATQHTASEGHCLRTAIAALCAPRGAGEFEIDAMYFAIGFAYGERAHLVTSGRLNVTWEKLGDGSVMVVASYAGVSRMTVRVTPDMRSYGELVLLFAPVPA